MCDIAMSDKRNTFLMESAKIFDLFTLPDRGFKDRSTEFRCGACILGKVQKFIVGAKRIKLNYIYRYTQYTDIPIYIFLQLHQPDIPIYRYTDMPYIGISVYRYIGSMKLEENVYWYIGISVYRVDEPGGKCILVYRYIGISG